MPARATWKPPDAWRTLPTSAGHPALTGGARDVVVARPAAPALPAISRRRLMRVAFWAGLGTLAAAGGAALLESLYPRRAAVPGGQTLVGTTVSPPFGGKMTLGNAADLQPGVPVHNLDARVWLVKFDVARAKIEQEAGNNVQPGAILALYQKCPHLGCTVPWRADFTWTDDRPGVNQTYSGWFRCPCHGSTYTFGGVRVFGPAPRSMDTFAIAVANGNLVVDTGKITLGDTHDPNRAIML